MAKPTPAAAAPAPALKTVTTDVPAALKIAQRGAAAHLAHPSYGSLANKLGAASVQDRSTLDLTEGEQALLKDFGVTARKG